MKSMKGNSIMKRITCIVLASLAVVLGGCVTPKATTPPSADVNFRQFRKVHLVVTDAVNTPYSKDGLPMFQGLLAGRLKSAGYTLVDTNPDMIIDVNVHQFDPGNRALRTVIGFGAGRAVLKYTASFQEPAGKLMAQLDGGKAYHGLEVDDNPTFKSDEATRMGLMSYSVSQIAEFVQSHSK
jgi:hypothetical protein